MPYYDVHVVGKRGWISAVVKEMVRPDNRPDILRLEQVLFVVIDMEYAALYLDGGVCFCKMLEEGLRI